MKTAQAGPKSVPNSGFGRGRDGNRFRLGQQCNENGIFEEVASDVKILGEQAVDNRTVTGAWGDYNSDGFVDLLIIYGANDGWWNWLGGDSARLWQNVDGENCREFLDVTDDIDLDLTDDDSYYYSPQWADFDGDGDVDLYVMADNYGSDEAGFYRENDGGTFVDGHLVIPNDTGWTGKQDGVAAVVDVDNDGHLDVVWAINGGGNNGELGCLINELDNDNGFIIDSDATTMNHPLDMGALDWDLDGWVDVIGGAGSSGSWIYWFANIVDPDGERMYIDVSKSMGDWDVDTPTHGFCLANFNRSGIDADGFTEFFRTEGRDLVTPNKDFYKASWVDVAVYNHWIGVRLESALGVNNRRGIGATVIISYDSPPRKQAQVIDGGGSGRASQHDLDLVFGLGDFSGNVDIDVMWPSGWTQSFSGLSSGEHHLLEDYSLVLDNSNVSMSRKYVPLTGLEAWTFEWYTNIHTNPANDKIRFTDNTVGCEPEATTILRDSDSDVEVTVNINPNEEGWHKHTLIWENVECQAVCTYYYTAESATVDFTETSDEERIKVTICAN